jgi:hypothetical protein
VNVKCRCGTGAGNLGQQPTESCTFFWCQIVAVTSAMRFSMTYALAKTSAPPCTTRRSRFDSYRKKQRDTAIPALPRGTCCLVGRGDAPVLGEGCEPLTSRRDGRLRDRLPNCQQRSPYRASGLVLLAITGHVRTPARLLRYGEIDLQRLARRDPDRHHHPLRQWQRN